MSFDYPDVGVDAQPEVWEALDRFRRLPIAEKVDTPALYWLIGSGGTPTLKMSKLDSTYVSYPVRGQKCGTCRYAYQHVNSGSFICSQIGEPGDSTIEPEAWCRLWAE